MVRTVGSGMYPQESAVWGQRIGIEEDFLGTAVTWFACVNRVRGVGRVALVVAPRPVTHGGQAFRVAHTCANFSDQALLQVARTGQHVGRITVFGVKMAGDLRVEQRRL